MILYIGNEEESQFVRECLNEQIFYEKAVNSQDIDLIFSKAMSIAYNWIFIDVSYLIFDASQLVSYIAELKNINKKSKVVIVARGYDQRSTLIHELEKIDVYNVINAELEGEVILQLQDIIMGKNIPITEIPVESEEEKIIRKTVKIGVLGCCPRIGTTTQSLQLIQYLNLCNKKSCYIELNNNEFIDTLDNLYEDLILDEDIGRVRCNDIDLYRDFNKMNDQLDNYDYAIFDYGYINENFNIVSFLEKDIQIIVGGFSSTEIQSMTNVFQNNMFSKNTKWIFSFIPENMKEEIKDSMDIYSDVTYFSSYQPDMFFYTPNDNKLYEQILSVQPEINKNKRFSIFGRRK